MAKKSSTLRAVQAGTGINLVFSFVFILAANYVILLLSHWLFPEAIVFGTHTMSPEWSLLLIAEKLALISTFAIPYVAYQEWKRNSDYSPKEWMTTYFFVNAASVWLLSRFASNLGFGISSFWVAIFLGAALDWAQGMAMMGYSKATGQEG